MERRTTKPRMHKTQAKGDAAEKNSQTAKRLICFRGNGLVLSISPANPQNGDERSWTMKARVPHTFHQPFSLELGTESQLPRHWEEAQCAR